MPYLTNSRRRKFSNVHVLDEEHRQQSPLNLCVKQCEGHEASDAERAASPKARHLTVT